MAQRFHLTGNLLCIVLLLPSMMDWFARIMVSLITLAGARMQVAQFCEAAGLSGCIIGLASQETPADLQDLVESPPTYPTSYLVVTVSRSIPEMILHLTGISTL